MYIERVPNRNSPPCVLLRESYREDGKVKKRTLANLSGIPPNLVAGLQAMISGRGVVVDVDDIFEIIVTSTYFEGETCPLAMRG